MRSVELLNSPLREVIGSTVGIDPRHDVEGSDFQRVGLT
jgi:hypothetical protein